MRKQAFSFCLEGESMQFRFFLGGPGAKPPDFPGNMWGNVWKIMFSFLF